MTKSKDEQIAWLLAQLEDINGTKKIEDFRAEAARINNALISQVRLLCQQLTEAEPLCELSTTVCQQIEKARNELDQTEETITSYLDWKDTDVGKEAKLPRIYEPFKDILFTEWNTQMMKEERAASRCKMIANDMIDLVNNTLYWANMIS